ncbi:MAG: hypothetical protein ACOYYS_23770 [Chloroflexota bacterium]
MEERTITIIEGPPPTFETVQDGWLLGVSESAHPAQLAMTRLRTFNGQALVERCNRSWRKHGPMHLEYRQSDGLISEVPIVAARNVNTPEGDMLLLWVRMSEEIELELGYEDGDDDGLNPE